MTTSTVNSKSLKEHIKLYNECISNPYKWNNHDYNDDKLECFVGTDDNLQLMRHIITDKSRLFYALVELRKKPMPEGSQQDVNNIFLVKGKID